MSTRRSTKSPAAEPGTNGVAELYEWAYYLMSKSINLRPDVAERAAKRLVRLVNENADGVLVGVYGRLLPQLEDPDRHVAMHAAFNLGVVLEQLRRMPARERDARVRAGSKNSAAKRRHRDKWLAEVEARPAGTPEQQAIWGIVERGGERGPEFDSVRRAVARAKADRKKAASK